MVNSLNNVEKIKKEVQRFFEKAGFPIEAEVKSLEENTFSINLTIEEPRILIGERGQTLADIQHLLKLILRKKITNDQPFYIDLDINDYKKKKIEYLKELAKSAADEVSLSKKEKELLPMPAYERRIIHLELAARGDVVSESIGQEPERKVVIRPCP